MGALISESETIGRQERTSIKKQRKTFLEQFEGGDFDSKTSLNR